MPFFQWNYSRRKIEYMFMKIINVICFRCQNVQDRKRYVNLVDSVRDSGGDVKVFSSMHVSGEREYYF